MNLTPKQEEEVRRVVCDFTKRKYTPEEWMEQIVKGDGRYHGDLPILREFYIYLRAAKGWEKEEK